MGSYKKSPISGVAADVKRSSSRVKAQPNAEENGSTYFDPGFVGGGPAVCRFDMELRLLEKAWCSGSQAEAFMRQLS